MKKYRKMRTQDLKFEYGVDGIRLLPWDGLAPPFGGAYCIVRPHSVSLPHVNSPDDEEEIFVCISGSATVVLGDEKVGAERGDVFYVPRGMMHCIENSGDEPFHFYALWWNKESATSYLRSWQQSAE